MFMFILLLFAVTSSLSYPSDEFLRRKISVDMKTFRKQNLECHNKYRKLHGVQPLSRTAELDKVAQDHAAILAHKDEFFNAIPNNSSYGTSVLTVRNVMIDGTTACMNWYSEENLYDYIEEKQEPNKNVCHFTQMVSRASCFMGIGLGISKSGNIYIVAMYDPPGNVWGKYKKNVFPPGNSYKHTLNLFELLTMTPVCGNVEKVEYMEQNLKCHNTLRKMHGVPPLVYSDKLNKYAENLANWMAFEKRVIPFASLYQACVIKYEGRKKNGYHYCQGWYDKGRNYDAQYFHLLDTSITLKNPASCYSQMIWKSTLHLGFAIGLANDGSLYTVAVYDPPGNQRGHYWNNIFPMQADTSSSSIRFLISHLIFNLYFILFFSYLVIT